MDFPADLKYTKDHEWVRLEADGKTAVVGITDFAQSELGDIVYVDLEDVDELIEQDSTFGSVEAVKTVSDLFMPLTGTIVAHNERIQDEPELVNSDPYGEGWMIKVSLVNAADVDGLMSAEDYANQVAG